MNYLKLRNDNLPIDFIINSENVKKKLTKEEEYTIKFIKDWKKGRKFFEFMSSGSTGRPKKISLSRKVLEYSAFQTLNALKIKSPGILLLCIPPQFMGGTMVIVRSLVGNLDLEVISPENLMDASQTYELVSLVPLQIQKILRTCPLQLDKFKNILIGGAPLHPSLENLLLNDPVTSNIYVTFGMTETASHFALRKIGDPYFKTIGDIRIQTDENNCLMVNGMVTGEKWLKTNDIVKIVASDSFQWLGRNDFVINSGGFKVHPEKVESLLSNHLTGRNYMITGIDDNTLGQKVICLIEGEPCEVKVNFNEFHRYERPKEFHFIPTFKYTDSGKIDRIKTKNLFLHP